MSRNKYPEETVNLILDVAEKLMLEKGYDNTSIQDIIDGLGGLSKGAIYHHFKSKEEIFNAVADRCNKATLDALIRIRDDKTMNGFCKLRAMYEVSLADGVQPVLYSVSPNMLENPRLLALQVKEIFNVTGPQYIQPIIEEGMRDGSIKTDSPKELSEVILLLTNIWLNPLVACADIETQIRRVRMFNDILKIYGVDLLTEDMLESYSNYCQIYSESHR